MSASNSSSSTISIEQRSNWIPGLLEISRQAAQAILEIYERADFEVEQKSDHSPVTAADLASHRIISGALQTLTPGIPVLSEESAAEAFEQRRAWPRLWLVDPLDGTREFIKRNGEFTINIALIEQHRAVLGLIAVPVERMAYIGLVGQGAQRWRDYTAAEPIETRRPCPAVPTVLGSRSHSNVRLESYFKRLDQTMGEYHRIGAGSALKFCRVAEGTADFYPRFGPTSEWDTAAGQALVEAAGGRVWLADGREMVYNARDSLLNGSFLTAGDPCFDWPRPAAA